MKVCTAVELRNIRKLSSQICGAEMSRKRSPKKFYESISDRKTSVDIISEVCHSVRALLSTTRPYTPAQQRRHLFGTDGTPSASRNRPPSTFRYQSLLLLFVNCNTVKWKFNWWNLNTVIHLYKLAIVVHYLVWWPCLVTSLLRPVDGQTFNLTEADFGNFLMQVDDSACCLL